MGIGRKLGNSGLARLWLFAAAALGAAILLPRAAAAASEQVLYSFCPQSGCADGANPQAGLFMDMAGNLYGTTFNGGDTNQGAVFALAPDGTETLLHSFCFNCPDGANPQAGVIMDAAGNLYGTTVNGGGAANRGAVFALAPDGTETVLYSFCQQSGCADGAGPTAGLITDAAGNLYGTTGFGGASGQGIVFAVAPDGTEAILYSFCAQSGCIDGNNPEAGLIMDGAGNLYGTTFNGGLGNNGVVFELAPDGTETVLYRFAGPDGANPRGGLFMDAAGNLYGTTFNGGANNRGVVFELAPDGSETVLYSFCSQSGCADGANPEAGLLMDGAGNLYGTTVAGGAGGLGGNGVVFGLAPDGTETALYAFCPQPGCADGAFPRAGSLIIDATGNLYGTTAGGGNPTGAGVVFELTP